MVSCFKISSSGSQVWTAASYKQLRNFPTDVRRNISDINLAGIGADGISETQYCGAALVHYLGHTVVN